MKVLDNSIKMIIKALLILMAFGELIRTNSYYSPYLLICIASFLCIFGSRGIWHNEESSRNSILSATFAAIFSIMVALANYAIWKVGGVEKYVLLATILLGTFFAFESICKWVAINVAKIRFTSNKIAPRHIFWISFAMILLVDLFVLFLCKYPGELTPDSIDQVYQMFGINEYTNHHPYYHTMTAKLFIDIGMTFFNEINAAIAFFMVVQIVFISLAFSYAAQTICEIGTPQIVAILFVVFCVVMPFNIMYSFTLWKDVPFGIFVMLSSVSIFRLLNKIGDSKLNYFLLAISGIGVCLFRSNGLVAFLAFSVVCALIIKFNPKKLVIVLVGIIVVSFIMKHPILKTIGVKQPIISEALSIPLQQIARVIKYDNDLSLEERDTISKVFDIDSIEKDYLEFISDPIKVNFNSNCDTEYFEEHKRDLLQTYISVGVKHIPRYAEAYIEQTKGYWNSGYDYWRYADGVYENELGIKRTVVSNFVNKVFQKYLWLFERPLLQVLVSIGVYTWGLLMCLFINLVKRENSGVIATSLPIAVIITLLITTPVFAEFRYAYASFTTLPVLIVLSLFWKNENV